MEALKTAPATVEQEGNEGLTADALLDRCFDLMHSLEYPDGQRIKYALLYEDIGKYMQRADALQRLKDVGIVKEQEGKKPPELELIAYTGSVEQKKVIPYGHYLVVRKDGKTHMETFNTTGWAYNNNAIRWFYFPKQSPTPDTSSLEEKSNTVEDKAREYAKNKWKFVSDTNLHFIDCAMDFKEGYKSGYLSRANEQGKEAAVGFAEWLRDNAQPKSINRQWVLNIDKFKKEYTLPELFEIYTSQINHV